MIEINNKIEHGHPNFSITLALANRDVNLIYTIDESGVTVAHLRDDLNRLPVIPSLITNAIMSQIDELSSSQQRILNAATVIGIRFDAQTLSSVADVTVKELGEDLKNLVKR